MTRNLFFVLVATITIAIITPTMISVAETESSTGGGGGVVVPKPTLLCSLAADSPRGIVGVEGDVQIEVVKLVLEAKGADIFVSGLKFEARGRSLVQRVFVVQGATLNGQGSIDNPVPVHLIIRDGDKIVLAIKVDASAGWLRLSLVGVEAHADLGGGVWKPVEPEGLPVRGNRVLIKKPPKRWGSR